MLIIKLVFVLLILISCEEKNEKSNGAKKNKKKEDADGEEVFVRLSAYKNDIRIDFENKKLKKGTYTTTEKDYLDCVANECDPIDRYALPNNEKIKWSFYIRPKKLCDSFQRGIAQETFGHKGGGEEIYFEDGTSNNTYLFTKSYGK